MYVRYADILILMNPCMTVSAVPRTIFAACCGTEFGYDDSTVAHTDLREKWVSDGMQWWSKHQLKPNDWDPVRQLKNN